MVKAVSKKHSNSFASFFVKLKGLMFSPGKILSQKEDWVDVLRFYFIVFFSYLIIGNLISLYYGNLNWAGFVLSFITSVIFTFLIVFLVTAIAHLGVMILRGKKGFFETFKPVTYALTIVGVYMFISLIIALIIPFNALSQESLEYAQQIQDPELVNQILVDFFMQPGAIVSLILGILSLIHFLVFSIAGISKHQNISKVKSTFAIILGLLIFLVVLIFIAFLAYLASPNVPF